MYFLYILRKLYFVLWTIVILCAFDTRFIMQLACLLAYINKLAVLLPLNAKCNACLLIAAQSGLSDFLRLCLVVGSGPLPPEAAIPKDRVRVMDRIRLRVRDRVRVRFKVGDSGPWG